MRADSGAWRVGVHENNTDLREAYRAEECYHTLGIQRPKSGQGRHGKHGGCVA